MSLVQVVLGRVVEDAVVVGTWRSDLGHSPKMKAVKRVETLMWLREADKVNVCKATLWAKENGYQVLIMPASESDPLGKAKEILLNA